MRRCLLLLLMLAWSVPSWATPDLSGLAYDPHPGAQVPLNGTLHDARGRATTLRAIMAGRPLLLVLGYHACPNLCGTVRDDVALAIAGSGLHVPRDAALVFASVDPAETPAVAAHAQGGQTAWRFVVGDVAPVARAVGFAYRADHSDRISQILHPSGLVVLTPAGIVSSYLLGVGTDPAKLRAAVMRAAASEVSPAPNPILLLCFHFDPATGRYSFAVLRVLRLAAAATVLAGGAWLILAHRRPGGGVA